MPPPILPVALFPLMALFVSVSVPELKIPPPKLLDPLAIVNPEMATVRPGPIVKTLKAGALLR